MIDETLDDILPEGYKIAYQLTVIVTKIRFWVIVDNRLFWIFQKLQMFGVCNLINAVDLYLAFHSPANIIFDIDLEQQRKEEGAHYFYHDEEGNYLTTVILCLLPVIHSVYRFFILFIKEPTMVFYIVLFNQGI